MKKQIQDYIRVANFIPKQVCESLAPFINDLEWRKHHWTYATENGLVEFSNETKELDVANADQKLNSILMPYILSAMKEYGANVLAEYEADNLTNIAQTVTPIRFNRYASGTLMRKHFDHINSIFDGKHKGIPVLSIVGVLNDDYVGGEFVFFDGLQIPFRAGDILIFPSNFLYPHEVREVTAGVRSSFVSWAF